MTKISVLVVIAVFSACAVAGPLPSGMFGHHFQGDIKLTEAQQNVLKGITPMTGWRDSFFRWHKDASGHTVVHYLFDPNAGFTDDEIRWMESELRSIEERTCIRFEKRTVEHDYVEIINGGGCWSWLGRIGGRQELSMDRNGCLYAGTMAHEAIHALGYDHMHNSIERDDYVEIFWDNIQPDFHSAFDKVDPDWFYNFGTTYDLRSIMHYPRWAFSNNGQDAILPRDRSYSDIIGETGVISEGDVTRLLRMHECL